MKNFFIFNLILLIIIVCTEVNYPDILYKLYVKACFQYDANFETEIKNRFRRVQLDFTMDFLCFNPEEEKEKLKKYSNKKKLTQLINLVLNSDLSEIREEGKTMEFRFINKRNIGQHIYYHVLGSQISETNEKCLMIEQSTTVFSTKNRQCNTNRDETLLLAYERNVLYGTNIYFSTIVNNLEKSFTVADIVDETFH